MADQENTGKEGHGLGGEELIHIHYYFYCDLGIILVST
jgi:hypothetical protein